MSSPNDPSDQQPPAPEQQKGTPTNPAVDPAPVDPASPGPVPSDSASPTSAPSNSTFASPGGGSGMTAPPPPASPAGGPSGTAPSYGTQPYADQPPSGQPYGSQSYGGQPYGGQPYGGGQAGQGQPGGTPPGYGGGQPPYGTPTGGSGTNKFGRAALIIGGVSFLLAFVPVVNYVSGILALVGLVLGIVGLVVKNRTRGLAIGGVILSTLALILSIVLAIVYTFGFASTVIGEISDGLPDRDTLPSATATPDPDAREVEVVYEVTGEATDATIVYFSATSTEGDGTIETLSQQTLPWTDEFQATVGGELDYSVFNVTASNGTADEGEISCRITVDGEVVAEEKADGTLGVVSCIASEVG